GTFAFTGAVPGPYRVIAQAAGHQPAAQSALVPGGGPASVTLALGAQSTLHGTVRDSGSGASLAGAELLLTGQGQADTSYSASTDAQGHYSFAMLAPGTYTLTLTAPGYNSSVLPNLVLGAGDDLVNTNLDPANTDVRGVVQSATAPVD